MQLRTCGEELLQYTPQQSASSKAGLGGVADPEPSSAAAASARSLSGLLEVARRLLLPTTGESESCFVGALVFEMLDALPHHLAPIILQVRTLG